MVKKNLNNYSLALLLRQCASIALEIHRKEWCAIVVCEPILTGLKSLFRLSAKRNPSSVV